MPASPAQPSDPLDLVLHIGSGKTGTSSIQHFLSRNRARLADLGHLYPRTPGQTRHVRLGLFIKPDEALVTTPSWQRQRASSPESFRNAFQNRLFREINQSGLSSVLFSDEALYGSSERSLRRLRALTDRIAYRLRLVVYLRRQDDHLVSRYQQVVKVGETRRLTERMRQLEFSQTYDYYARLRTWERLLEPTDFVVRRFERDAFAGGSLHQDFLQAVGIDARADQMEQVESVNESLDAEAVEFLRIVNIVRGENPDAARSLPSNGVLIDGLAVASTGPTLTMPTSTLDAFMAQWKKSNRRVAAEFLADESEALFRLPRRTSGTTAEQHLDPKRLDHFLNLLEIPKEIRAPLRKASEREAKVR